MGDWELGLIPLGIAGIIAIPLLIYHFLIFPNIDGVIQDLSWYTYDSTSQHFVYWFFFWGVTISSAYSSFTLFGGKK